MPAAPDGAVPPEGGWLEWVDPRDLLTHRGNLRTDLGDLTELEDSIAELGVLQSLLVIPAGQQLRVVAGHRRTAAAAAVLDAGRWNPALLPLVPCLVRPDLAEQPAEQVFTMLDENGPREGLRQSEKAKGYAQLAAFDVPVKEIARRAGQSVEHVTAAIRLDKMDAPVKEKVDAGQLTIEHLIAMQEFENEPAVVGRIIAAAGTSWGPQHEIAVERRKREDKKRAAELKAQLQAEGVRIVARPKGWPEQSKAVSVHKLKDATGEPLNVDEVKTKDGFAAFVDTSGTPHVTYVCLDPEAHGLTRPRWHNYKSPEALQKEQKEQSERETRRRALNIASGVRRQFIREAFGTAKAAKRLLPHALRTAVLDPSNLTVRNNVELFEQLDGSLTGIANAGLERLQRLLVCRWVAAREDKAGQVGDGGWELRTHCLAALQWLDMLVEHGYSLSEAETGLRRDLVEQVVINAEADAYAEAAERARAEGADSIVVGARGDESAEDGDEYMLGRDRDDDASDGEWWLANADGEELTSLPGVASADVAAAQQAAAAFLATAGLRVTRWDDVEDDDIWLARTQLADDAPENTADLADEAQPAPVG